MKSERNKAKNEEQWDKLLHIHTTGRDDSKADQFRYPYEPTPYSVLQRLANEGLIRKGDTLIDYGCGKGRVDFFLSYQTKCHTIGVEYDERLYEKAMEAAGKAEYEVVASLKGAEMEYMKAKHPFIDRESLVIVGDHVTLESGTGCVHTDCWNPIMHVREKSGCFSIIRRTSIFPI